MSFLKSQSVVQDCETSFDLVDDRNTKMNKIAIETETKIEKISISQILTYYPDRKLQP